MIYPLDSTWFIKWIALSPLWTASTRWVVTSCDSNQSTRHQLSWGLGCHSLLCRGSLWVPAHSQSSTKEAWVQRRGLYFTSITDLLLCGWILSTKSNFTHNIKGLQSMLSSNWCYRLWPLMTALEWGDEVTLPWTDISLSWGGGGRRKDFYMKLHHHAKKKHRKTPVSWASGLQKPLDLSLF